MSHIDLLWINDNDTNFLGGAEQSLRILINDQKDKLKCGLLNPGSDNIGIEGIEVYCLTKTRRLKKLVKNPFAFFIYVIKVGRLIKKVRPKIIHCQSEGSLFILGFLRKIRLIDKKIIIVQTDRGLCLALNKFYHWLYEKSLEEINYLVTTTEFNGKCWKENNKTKKKIDLKYLVIENTAGGVYERIDMNRVSNNQYLTICFAGRMCPWKGWSLAEDISVLALQKIQDIHIIMNVSCLSIKDEKAALEMFGRLSKLFGKNFQGNINVPFEKMEDMYYASDVYILTSDKNMESFGRTLVEAMSRYNAVLTTRAGGSEEVVGNEENVCDYCDEFVNKLVFWNNNREILNNEKINNIERVKVRYSLYNNLMKYNSLYQNILKELDSL